jgi:hypothetical protein
MKVSALLKLLSQPVSEIEMRYSNEGEAKNLSLDASEISDETLILSFVDDPLRPKHGI